MVKKSKDELIKDIQLSMIDKNMNQTELAKRIDVNPSRISLLFTRGIGSIALIKKITVVLDMKVDFRKYI